MNKDFSSWNSRKVILNNKEIVPFFYEREVWWCSIGINVGREEDGKNQHFERPVLIIKQFNQALFWGVPLSSKIRVGSYYFTVELPERKSLAILLQLRLFSSKRLLRKIWTLDKGQYSEIKEAIRRLLI